MNSLKNNAMETITLKQLQKKLGELRGIQENAENYVVLAFENGSLLYSYKTLVAGYCNFFHYFTTKHDYSVTTCKQVKKYCGYNSTTIREMLRDGTATLIL